MTINAFIDGASRKNPGESGIGVILKNQQGTTLQKVFGYIGKATNNIAEYKALLKCLKTVRNMPCERLVVHSDSELMVRQLNGDYRVKDLTLKRYFQQVHRLLQEAPFQFEIKHVMREQNKEADRLANLGIDTKRRVTV